MFKLGSYATMPDRVDDKTYLLYSDSHINMKPQTGMIISTSVTFYNDSSIGLIELLPSYVTRGLIAGPTIVQHNDLINIAVFYAFAPQQISALDSLFNHHLMFINQKEPIAKLVIIS